MTESRSTPKPASIRIHQAVHGYDRGHRLLAASCSFDEAADDQLGSMSDLLTTKLLEDGSSYLSGYPLKSQNAYVLARTWAASEMPRPGSVWTHSLIIDYQTLATLENPIGLVATLRRPELKLLSSFSKAIAQLPSHQEDLFNSPPSVSRAAIACLYAGDQERLVQLQSTATKEDEHLVLALWRQMWPALRRDTAFFSFADAPPPNVDANCIIGFTNDPALSRENSGVNEQAISILTNDLPVTAQTPLRSFLARYAFDAPVPRASVIPLVNLWYAATQSGPEMAIAEWVQTAPHANAARLARFVFGSLDENRSGNVDLLRIVQRFGTLKVDLGKGGLNLPAAIMSAADLSELLESTARNEQGTLGFAVFEALVTQASLEALAQSKCSDFTTSRMLDVQPALLDQPAFWNRRKTEHPTLVRLAARAGRPAGTILGHVAGNLNLEIICALIDGWPDDLAFLIDVLPPTSEGQRLVAITLAQSPNLLERTLASNVSLSSELIELTIEQGFRDNRISYPPSNAWGQLASRNRDGSALDALVLDFAAAVAVGYEGREKILALFPTLVRAARRHYLTANIRLYFDKIFRALNIYCWSLSDGLYRILIVKFREGGSISAAVFRCIDDSDIADLTEALYNEIDLSAVKDFLRRAHQSKADVDLIRFLEEFVRRKERRWFF